MSDRQRNLVGRAEGYTNQVFGIIKDVPFNLAPSLHARETDGLTSFPVNENSKKDLQFRPDLGLNIDRVDGLALARGLRSHETLSQHPGSCLADPQDSIGELNSPQILRTADVSLCPASCMNLRLDHPGSFPQFPCGIQGALL